MSQKVEYFQHNLVNTNLCVFTYEALVCNPSYIRVAKFVIKLKEGVNNGKRPYFGEKKNLKNPWWKNGIGENGEIVYIK